MYGGIGASEYKLDEDANIVIVHACPDKEIFDAIRATELYEEMEKKVAAYRQRKGM